MKHIILSAAALVLAGCGSTPMIQDSEDVVRGKAYLQECLASTHIKPMHRACFNYYLSKVGDEAKAQAKQHWDSYMATLGPDERLLGAVFRQNTEAAREAISSGANVNREFSASFLNGPSVRNAESKTTVLMQAGFKFDLEMMELLLQNGANPSWKEGEDRFDVVANLISRSGITHYEDGTRETVTGLQVGELAFKYGYRPDALALDFIGSQAKNNDPSRYGYFDIKPFYQQLLNSSSPQVRKELAAIEAKRHRSAAEREAQRAVELEKRRVAQEDMRRQHQLLASQQKARMRAIGTRVCVDRATQIGVVTYVGYVENVAVEKVQIRVSQAFFKMAPTLAPGGFQPSIIWDNLSDWRMCE
ncbi:hypothetical protein I0E98_10635 [Pseudomonas lalucatii]|nr:hypothetical protein [Pseudomonas lalucatii]